MLCEKNQISLLCELPFVGLVEEVKSVLEDKARQNDITKPPFYYNILYTFHIHRCNYRQGNDYCK